MPILTVRGDLPAIVFAKSQVALSSSPSGSTRLMRPMAWARSAVIASPVSSISMACLRGTARERATIGVEQKRPILTPGVAKRAPLGGERQVAAGDELAARGGGDAMDLGDDRLGQMQDGEHQFAAAPEDRLMARAARLAAQLLQVMPRAEARTRGGQYHDLHRGIAGKLGQRSQELAHQGHGKGVARLGPVEGEGGDGIPVLAQQDGLVLGGGALGHGQTPSGSQGLWWGRGKPLSIPRCGNMIPYR